MPLYYACDANVPEGEPITPVSRVRVQQGKFFVPDCPDYESKFGLPKKVKLKTVYAGWSCFNCVHLLQSRDPFQGPRHVSFPAQRQAAPEPDREAPPAADAAIAPVADSTPSTPGA